MSLNKFIYTISEIEQVKDGTWEEIKIYPTEYSAKKVSEITSISTYNISKIKKGDTSEYYKSKSDKRFIQHWKITKNLNAQYINF